MTFVPWKTITLGLHKSAVDYRHALALADLAIACYADEILDKITCSQKVDVDLVLLSVADLGFIEGARYAHICARAEDLGLKPCPAEVGPALRLQHADQPDGEWCYITMEPIVDHDRDPFIFNVGRQTDGLWLGNNLADPDCVFNLVDHFVFVLPRK